MTAILLGLRLGRWGAVAFTLAAFLITFIQTLGFYKIAGHTPAERAAFGESMQALASQLMALFPPPVRPDTVGGYVQFRGFNALQILFTIWALASATGFARGDEERGVLESALAAGVSRVGLVASRVAAFAIAVALAAAAGGAGFIVGVAAGHETVDLRGVVNACLLLVALALAAYAISLFIAQVASARFAAAAAGVALLALFLLNSLSRTLTSLAAWRWLSPFHYYDLSQPLPPGGNFDARSLSVLFAIAVATAVIAGLAFAWRDLGAALFRVPSWKRPARFEASANPLWTIPVLRGVYERRGGVLVWAAGMAGLAVVFVSLTKTIAQVMLSIPSLLPFLSAFVHQQLYPSVLGYTWLNVAQLLFAGLAITHVSRWSAEDVDGRLEITLTEPFSRAAVVAERMATFTAIALVIAAVGGAALYLSSRAQGIDLNLSRLIAASFMLVPFALLFAGVGSLLAGWNPRAAVGVLGAFAFASYLDTELGPIFNLPLWLQDLSAFRLFGTPLLSGADGRNLALLLLLSLAGLASSILAMERRDVGA